MYLFKLSMQYEYFANTFVYCQKERKRYFFSLKFFYKTVFSKQVLQTFKNTKIFYIMGE